MRLSSSSGSRKRLAVSARPVVFTPATTVFEDCHVASALTFCVDPPLRFAVAVNCADVPTGGAEPVAMTLKTVGPLLAGADADGAAGLDGELLQAATSTA